MRDLSWPSSDVIWRPAAPVACAVEPVAPGSRADPACALQLVIVMAQPQRPHSADPLRGEKQPTVSRMLLEAAEKGKRKARVAGEEIATSAEEVGRGVRQRRTVARDGYCDPDSAEDDDDELSSLFSDHHSGQKMSMQSRGTSTVAPAALLVRLGGSAQGRRKPRQVSLTASPKTSNERSTNSSDNSPVVSDKPAVTVEKPSIDVETAENVNNRLRNDWRV